MAKVCLQNSFARHPSSDLEEVLYRKQGTTFRSPRKIGTSITSEKQWNKEYMTGIKPKMLILQLKADLDVVKITDL